jgi:hypothetical protein
VVLAWSILTILVAAGSTCPARAAQATHRIASSTAPVILMTSASAAAKPAISATYVAQPGNTLSGIAAALSQPGRAGSKPAPPIVTTAASGMPWWLKAMLHVVGLAIGAALIAEPAIVISRRRRRDASRRRAAQLAVAKANVIQADHDRLIVMYSLQDDTIYLLTPPGEDPRAVLRAARLVVPEEKYGQLADHLGVPASWPLE